MAEMTVFEYLKQRGRMTDNCEISCMVCPLSCENNSKNLSCVELESKYTEEAISIVQKWAEEHPHKTMMQDFFEKFKKAKRKPTGEPVICPYTLGYEPEPLACKTGELVCNKCWNRPLEE